MDTETLYRMWGERIRAARIDADMNQADLAEVVGTSQQRISQYETGARRLPDVLRPRIAKALNVDVAVLFAYDEVAA